MQHPIRLSSRLCALLFVAVTSASAGDYPSRPITLVVPYGAGGSNDTLSRIVAEHMSRTLAQPIIIENDPGAGGTTPAARAARAAADGYTLIMGNMGTHGVAPTQYANLKYDPLKDFTPIGLAAEVPAVIVTKKDFPPTTLKDFIDYVKVNEAKVNEANVGVGSPTHTFCTLLQSIMGTKTARVAYRGGSQAINDLVGGQVDFMCISLSGAVAQIQGGMVKPIAIASPERVPIIKDVPTTKEAGLPQFQVSAWNALFAQRNLPTDIQAKLTDALAKALDDASIHKRLTDLGFVIPDKAERTPDALRTRVETEVLRWSSLLKGAVATSN
jgi:tripartite-type tricarboxylate transporter receptor subunit TctC